MNNELYAQEPRQCGKHTTHLLKKLQAADLSYLGVRTRDVDGEFRKVVDIITDIAKVWGRLDKIQQVWLIKQWTGEMDLNRGVHIFECLGLEIKRS